MASLRRFSISVSELLMIEFALQPCHLDTPWKMRCHFINQFGACRNAAQCEAHHQVDKLHILARVLASHRDARVLALERLTAFKQQTAELYSGAHRLPRIEVYLRCCSNIHCVCRLHCCP